MLAFRNEDSSDRFIYLLKKNITFGIAFDKEPSFLGVDFVDFAYDGYTLASALEIGEKLTMVEIRFHAANYKKL